MHSLSTDTAGSQTAREIWQQPATWEQTASLMAWSAGTFAESIEDAHSIVLTGSGSSQCAVECVAPALASGLQVPVAVVAGGAILTDPAQTLPDADLMVSISRSGDSPESYAAIDLALSLRPRMKHLVITCNVNGRLATEFRLSDRVRVIILDEGTNDRGVVMTSSTTNLIVAASFLSVVSQPAEYKNKVATLSRAAETLLQREAGRIATLGSESYRRVLFLGTGARLGAAREAALKMLELTDGNVAAIAESYLGLRHGPMTFIHDDTLVVCFLSSSSPSRAYELDVIRELNTKHLGRGKLLVGDRIPAELADGGIECPGVGDPVPVVQIVVGQLLALSRCLASGSQPDSPSPANVITRVVPPFPIHSI